jgi:peptidoglycan/xylan/chitin deacetylase (PgdA/CDA1 family)
MPEPFRWSCDRAILSQMAAPLLTFDDGPSESTGEILELLRDYGVRATFFVIGFRAEQRPELVKQASDEGHVIGNHTWDHVALAQILNEAESDADLEQRIEVVRLKLQQASDAISKILGAPPALFRGPWLNIDDRVLEIAGSLGLSHIGVDVDTCDYDEHYDADYVATPILGAEADEIVLLHDGTGDDRSGAINPARPKTVEALRRTLPEFASRWRAAT